MPLSSFRPNAKVIVVAWRGTDYSDRPWQSSFRRGEAMVIPSEQRSDFQRGEAAIVPAQRSTDSSKVAGQSSFWRSGAVIVLA